MDALSAVVQPDPSRRVAALVALGVAIVVALGVAVVTDAADPVDAALIAAIRDDELRAPLGFLRFVTEAGATWAIVVVGASTLVLLSLLRQPLLGLAAALTLVVTSIANAVAKTTVARLRPDAIEPLIVERGYAFPSGHAVFGMVAWGVVALLVARSGLPLAVRRAIVIALIALIVLIGLSRVYLGAHHPTDVLAGWAAGAVIVLVFAQLTRTRLNRDQRPPGR